MSLATDIYNFRRPIEAAFAYAISAGGLDAYSTFTPPELERRRPRVEVAFLPGGARGRLFPVAGLRATAGTLREIAYAGTLHVSVVSGTEDAEQHEMDLANARYLLSAICRTVNAGLTHHVVVSCALSGLSASFKPDDGHMETQMQYAVEFHIRPEFLAQLET